MVASVSSHRASSGALSMSSCVIAPAAGIPTHSVMISASKTAIVFLLIIESSLLIEFHAVLRKQYVALYYIIYYYTTAAVSTSYPQTACFLHISDCCDVLHEEGKYPFVRTFPAERVFGIVKPETMCYNT